MNKIKASIPFFFKTDFLDFFNLMNHLVVYIYIILLSKLM